MKKYCQSFSYRIIYLLVVLLITFQFENFELFMIIMFLPYLAFSVTAYLQFDNNVENENHIILSKSNFNLWSLGFTGLLIVVCIYHISIYMGVLLFLAVVQLFFEYTISKRRILFIDKNGIDELGKDKHRAIKEISSLEMYTNNVEFRFNEYEILQINKNELVQPTWEDFLKRMNEIKMVREEYNSK